VNSLSINLKPSPSGKTKNFPLRPGNSWEKIEVVHTKIKIRKNNFKNVIVLLKYRINIRVLSTYIGEI